MLKEYEYKYRYRSSIYEQFAYDVIMAKDDDEALILAKNEVMVSQGRVGAYAFEVLFTGRVI